MSDLKRSWPWWTPAAAIVASVVFCCATWAGIGSLTGVAVRYADAKAREGTWSREAFFENARNLTTGRSVARIKVEPPVASTSTPDVSPRD